MMGDLRPILVLILFFENRVARYFLELEAGIWKLDKASSFQSLTSRDKKERETPPHGSVPQQNSPTGLLRAGPAAAPRGHVRGIRRDRPTHRFERNELRSSRAQRAHRAATSYLHHARPTGRVPVLTGRRRAMNPGTWSTLKAIVVLVAIVAVQVVVAFVTAIGALPYIVGLFLMSMCGLVSTLVVLLGSLGLRKLVAILVVVLTVVGWIVYPFVGTSVSSLSIEPIRVQGGGSSAIWLIILLVLVAAFVVALARGYRFYPQKNARSAGAGVRVQRNGRTLATLGVFMYKPVARRSTR